MAGAGRWAIAVVMCILSFTSHAQSVSTSIDKKAILIGEHINYELRFTLPTPDLSVDFNIPDSIPHFDIISKKKFDSSDKQGNHLVFQRILFTSFDSGKWSLPSFSVKIRNARSPSVFILNTDAIPIDVGYSPEDSTGQLRDIHTVMEVSIIDRSWIYIAIGILLALILAYFIYRYFRKRKKDKPLFESKMTAFDEAMQGLRQLQAEHPSSTESFKTFYTSLTDIFRRYMSRKEQADMMNNTTSDLLIMMKEKQQDSALIFTLADALRTSDAVKFAKYLPPQEETGKAVQNVQSVIQELEKSYTRETPKKAGS